MSTELNESVESLVSAIFDQDENAASSAFNAVISNKILDKFSEMKIQEAIRLLGNTSTSSSMMRYPQGHSPEGQVHRDTVAKMAKDIRSQGREIRRSGTAVDPTDKHAATPSVGRYNSQDVMKRT